MSQQIPSVWPAEIQIDAVSPLVIFRVQASKLRERTKGLLEADVKVGKATDGDIIYEFEIIAPSLGGYRYKLFRAWHTPDFIYPTTIQFQQWTEEDAAKQDILPLSRHFDEERNGGRRVASTPEELLDLLRILFNSKQAKGVLMSLIAKINDKPANSSQGPENGTGEGNGK